MLTGMTERDWAIVLEVFKAAQLNRGELGRDDRKFLEAIRYFTVNSITWRGLPSEFGNWNSVPKRFWRLSRSGGFSTQIHLKTDLDGNPLDFHLTGGEASGSTQFETSLDIGPDIRPRIAITDKGYDSQTNRAVALARGITPVIPRRENSKQLPRWSAELWRGAKH